MFSLSWFGHQLMFLVPLLPAACLVAPVTGHLLIFPESFSIV
jgi:hypothetical protein